MQLPTNASLAFVGFIIYYPLLDGHVCFWQSLSLIHFGYNLLSEIRKYVFLCRLAVKCYFLNKILYIFIHFGILHNFIVFRRPSWIWQPFLIFLQSKWYIIISLAVFFTQNVTLSKFYFHLKKFNQFSLFLATILGFGGHLELPKDARLASIRF